MTAHSEGDSSPNEPSASQPPSQPPAQTEPSLARGKRWLFRLATLILAPVVVVLLLEALLRVAGYGYPTAFLIPYRSPTQKLLVQNNQFAWRFLGADLSRLPYALAIPQSKPPRTIRIFVLGESAAYGDPLATFGLSRMLLAMLSSRYPSVHFEVENAAMTGINSHAILPIARDCAGAEGDLWVIYMGNNEVVGPFGAGTVFGPQTPPLPLIRASLWVNSTRTGKLIDSMLRGLQSSSGEKSEWGGMAMFLGQQVTAKDPRMDQVYHHFERNLADIIKAGTRSGAGIVLSTVAVNLKDCAPFASAHRPGLSQSDQAGWERLYALGSRAQDAGSNAAAAEFFDQAAIVDDTHAELRFRQGQCALARGLPAEAHRHFAAARDLDTLRFRCDSRLNDLIRKQADAANLLKGRVQLADAERAFGEQSRDGLPGEDLFYEHVHLTFDGNYLLARTIVEQVERLLPSWVTAQKPRNEEWPSAMDCARRLAWSDWTLVEAQRQMLARISQPPFSGQLGHEARTRKLQAALERLLPAAEGDGMHRAIKSCEEALSAAPDDAGIYAQLTMLKMAVGDFVGAEKCAVRQTELLPSNPVGWFHLGMIQLKHRRLPEALDALDRTVEVDPHNLAALGNRAKILLMQGRTDEGVRECQRVLRIQPGYCLVWMTLGNVYERTGRASQAEDCYRKAVAKNADVTQSATLAAFCQSRGWLAEAATQYEKALRLDPINPGMRLAAGKNLMDLQHHDLAAAEFREVLRLRPEMAEPRIYLGMTFMQQGLYPEAAAQFDQVLQQNPTNALALEYAELLRQNRTRASH